MAEHKRVTGLISPYLYKLFPQLKVWPGNHLVGHVSEISYRPWCGIKEFPFQQVFLFVQVKSVYMYYKNKHLINYLICFGILRTFFVCSCIGCRKNKRLHPQSLTARPWKMVVGRGSFPIGFRSLFKGELLNFARAINDIIFLGIVWNILR